jgi:hypothetical protein
MAKLEKIRTNPDFPQIGHKGLESNCEMRMKMLTLRLQFWHLYS